MAITLSSRVVSELNVLLVSMFDAGANDAVKKASDVIDLAFVSTSDSASNVYTMIGSNFALRDRGDSAETIVDGVKMYETRVANGDKYTMVEVDLNAFKDDKVDQFAGIFYNLGGAQALGPSRLMEDCIIASEVAGPLGNYDGVPLISTAHPVRPFEPGSPVWSNKLVRPAGLNFTTFGEACAMFESFPNEDGRPAGNRPTVLVCDPSYRQIAHDICYSDLPQDGSGGGNAWKGEIRPMIVPFLKNYDGWYLADDTSARERPWIYQEREPLRVIPLFTSHEDPTVLKSRKLTWMVSGRLGAGYGHAKKVLKVTKA